MSEKDIDALSDEGFKLVEQGLPEQALQRFERISEIDARNAEAWMMRGAIKAELGAPQDALDCLSRAISLDPEDVEAHYTRCKVLVRQGRLDEAVADGRKAVELDPEYGDAWLVLGVVQGLAGHVTDAEKSLRRAIELLPDSTEARIGLANALTAQGRLEETVPVYREVLARSPADAEVHCRIGAAFRAQGMAEEAERCYGKAIEIAPRSPLAYSGLAGVLVGQQRVEEALLNCRKALQIDPSCADAHVIMGTALLLGGSQEKQSLLKQLDQDHVYANPQEAAALTRRLSELYEYHDVSALESLIRLFSEFEPGRLYPAEWWTSALGSFGPQEFGHDKIARGVLSAVCCWSIPSKEAMDALARFIEGDRVFSFGAGWGYWEYLLQTYYGTNVTASDLQLRHRFVEMQRLDYADANVSDADTIFLSWIPRGLSSAEHLLEKLQSGQKLVLVGEAPDERGIAKTCATDRFFAVLSEQFQHPGTIPLVQFSYFRDSIELFIKG